MTRQSREVVLALRKFRTPSAAPRGKRDDALYIDRMRSAAWYRTASFMVRYPILVAPPFRGRF